MQVVTNGQLTRARENAQTIATRLNAAVQENGVIDSPLVTVGLHCSDNLANADEANPWLHDALDDLDTQFMLDDNMRFKAGTLGSVWVDTTLIGTLKNGKRHHKHVRVFWRGFSEDGKILIGLDVTFEHDFLTKSRMP